MLDATKRYALGLLSAMTSAALVAVACSGDDDAPPGDDQRTGDATRDGRPESYEGEDFYSVPSPLPDGEPGDLMRYQVIDSPTVRGAELSRIMYLSESVAGDPIAVTGLVAVPDGTAPPDGRPLLSVGHGTTGISDVCAPSRLTRQYLSWERSRAIPEVLELLGNFAERGHVVAATDYEGRRYSFCTVPPTTSSPRSSARRSSNGCAVWVRRSRVASTTTVKAMGPPWTTPPTTASPGSTPGSQVNPPRPTAHDQPPRHVAKIEDVGNREHGERSQTVAASGCSVESSPGEDSRSVARDRHA